MWVDRLAGLSAFLVVGAAAIVLILPSATPPAGAEQAPLMLIETNEHGNPDHEGADPVPLLIEDLPDAREETVWAEWLGEPVYLISLEEHLLEASSSLYGRDTMAHSMVHPEHSDLRVFAYNGKNTHLGCTHGFNHELGASKEHPDLNGDGVNEGRILSPCHHEQYDVYNLGKHDNTTPGSGDLWMLDLHVSADGVVIGTWSDDYER